MGIKHILVAQTQKNLQTLSNEEKRPWERIRENDSAVVALPNQLEKQIKTLVEEVVFKRICNAPRVLVMRQKSERILKTLFSSFMEEPITV